MNFDYGVFHNHERWNYVQGAKMKKYSLSKEDKELARRIAGDNRLTANTAGAKDE